MKLALVLILSGLAATIAAPDKQGSTPCFWQRDPDAGFENEGANHCAPVAISDGLVYLANSRSWHDLVDNTDHDGQIALITDLARKMSTDPVEGTNPDKIVTGLREYLTDRGYTFQRLEVATWRPLSARNMQHKIASKPDPTWIAGAAHQPDTIAILNFGWYKAENDGTYTRHSGHWVNVVGAGPGARDFEIHNPLLEPARQQHDTHITLEPLDDSFVATNNNGSERNMAGYYRATGPGLPFNDKKYSAAVLDSVIVFRLEKKD